MRQLNQRYFTIDGKEVTKFIESRKTIVFKSWIHAYEHSRNLKTYTYEVFDQRKRSIGHAVPLK